MNTVWVPPVSPSLLHPCDPLEPHHCLVCVRSLSQAPRPIASPEALSQQLWIETGRQSWFPGVKAETSQPPMRMKGLCMGVCTIFSCLNLVTSLSPPTAGMSNSALPAQLPPDTTPGEGLACLLRACVGTSLPPQRRPAHLLDSPCLQPQSTAPLLERTALRSASKGKPGGTR